MSDKIKPVPSASVTYASNGKSAAPTAESERSA